MNRLLRKFYHGEFLSRALSNGDCRVCFLYQGKSDVVAKADGTFLGRARNRDKRKAEDRGAWSGKSNRFLPGLGRTLGVGQ
jgi:hypothetical protein